MEAVDPGTARAEKIARFKRDKEVRTGEACCTTADGTADALHVAFDVGQINAKLDAIEQRVASRRSRGAASRGGDDASQLADDDEEDERAAWLLRIQSAVYKAVDMQPLLATEAALLASRPVVTPQMSAVQQVAGGAAAEPRPTAPSMVVIDALSRVTLTSERERMRGEVFRPSHILPTMTIEQFGACVACVGRMHSSAMLTLARVSRCTRRNGAQAHGGGPGCQSAGRVGGQRRGCQHPQRRRSRGGRKAGQGEVLGRLEGVHSGSDDCAACMWVCLRRVLCVSRTTLRRMTTNSGTATAVCGRADAKLPCWSSGPML